MGSEIPTQSVSLPVNQETLTRKGIMASLVEQNPIAYELRPKTIPTAQRKLSSQAPRPYTGNSEIISLIQKEFGADWNIAQAIAFAESGHRNNAVHYNKNGTVDKCTFQLNSVHGYSGLDDPATCIRYAHELYRKQGWRAWVVYKTGDYKKYLIKE